MRIRWNRYVSVFLACLLWQAGIYAQIRTVPKDLLDSIADPKVAEKSALMRFETVHICAGEIEESDRPVYEYRFVNASDRPLRVSRLAASCSCASAQAEPQTVAPGQEGTVKVTYHPEGHAGKFMRRIFVYTNLSDSRPTAVLTLDVSVRQGSDRSRWFPHEMGQIRTKVKEFTFSGDVKDVVCLAFLNTGNVPVTPVADAAMLPSFLKAWCDTPDVQPGKEGEICISFDPEKYRAMEKQRDGWRAGASADGPLRFPLVIGGVGAAPRDASIMIMVD